MGDDVDMENDVNFQNVSQANDTQCSKRSRGPSDSADHDRKNTRKSYRMLMETTAKFDDLDPREIEGKQFGKALKRTSKLFASVDRPQEALLDGQLFKQLSKLTKTQVESLSANKQNFSIGEFADRFLQHLESNGGRNGTGYQQIGAKYQHIFSRAVPLTYLHGRFEIEEEVKVPEEKKQRKPRKSNVVDLSLATQTEDGKNQNSETVSSLTEMLVESTLKQLKDAFLDNDEDPVCYFNFVLNPQSFSKSVENMFHFSFLIKENRASLELDEDGKGLPFVRPLKVRQTIQREMQDENAGKKHQAILSLTYDDWEDLVEQLEIKKPMIKHPSTEELKKKRRTMH